MLGNPEPDFLYGLSNDFSLKGFDLNVFINGVQGSKLFNLNRADLIDVSGQKNNSIEVLNRWTPTNPASAITRATKTRNTRISDRYIEDASYLRIKNISLGYSLPKSLIQKAKATNARIFISGQNLFTFTKYSGYDPEVNSRGGDNIQVATDFGSYPTSKTVTAGINLTF